MSTQAAKDHLHSWVRGAMAIAMTWYSTDTRNVGQNKEKGEHWRAHFYRMYNTVQYTYALKKWQVCLVRHPDVGSNSTDVTCQMEKRCVCVSCKVNVLKEWRAPASAPNRKCSCDNIPNQVSKSAAYECASN